MEGKDKDKNPVAGASQQANEQEHQDEDRIKEQLQTGEQLVMVSQLLNFRGKVDEVTIAAFKNHAKSMTKKTRLTKADQIWLDDYIEQLPNLLEQIKMGNEGTEVSENDLLSNPRTNVAAVAQLEKDSKWIQQPPRIKLNELVIRPATFNGTKPPPRRWLDDFEHAAEANSWGSGEKVCYFPTFLERSAMDWHISVVRPKWGLTPTWPDLKSAFIRHYLGDTDLRAMRRQLEQCVQREGEKATTFIPRVLRLMQLINHEMQESEKVDVIRDKLRVEFREKMVLSRLYTIEQLNDACLRIEAELPPVKNKFQASTRKGNSRKEERGAREKDKQDSESNKKANKDNKKSKTSKICYRCERKNHFASDCKAKSKANGEPCNERRKTVNYIAQSEENNEEATITTGLNFLSAITSPANVSDLICLKVIVNDLEIEALVDCGACCTVIDANVVREQQWAIRREFQELSHAAKGQVACVGTLNGSMSVSIGQTTMRHKGPITVVHNLAKPLILGIDFMAGLHLVVDPGSSRRVYFSSQAIKKGARLLKGQTLAPRSVNLVQTVVQTNDDDLIVRPFNFDRRIRVAHSLSAAKDGILLLELVNLDANSVTVQAGTQIATVERMPNVSKESSINPVLPLATTNETIVVGDSLSASQLKDIRNLLAKHVGAFSVNGSLGSTDLIFHEIELEAGSKPFKEPVRRHPPLHVAEVNKQVADMLEKGVIEPSTSPWASEYVVVKKKNGEFRICVDFRRLNNLTIKNSFPLPRIEDCLDNLNGNVYFTKLDFASGYWQLPVAESSRPLTAFRTGDGLYQFKKLPFGLSNAPASFQALINMLFTGLKGARLQVYLDDVCLASKDWSEHLQMLDNVFSIIERAGLKLRSSKCEIAVCEVTFLGHLITRDGVRQDPKRLRALSDLPAPTDVASLRRVLGAFGYYRKFIYKFSAIAAPLTKLLCKGTEFVWDREQQHAFNQLKQELLKNATLACPTPDDPIVVKTDASLSGIAGMALQQQNGQWKLLACCSRGLSPAERNYSITELEGLAAVDSIQKLRYLLLGRKFTLLVDHCALCVLNKNKAPNNTRLHRWALALSEFDFVVKYIKGTAHVDVDCLSRAPVKDEVDEFLPLLNLNFRPVDVDNWTANYNLLDQEIQEKAEEGIGGYYLSEGVIYYKGQLYVPEPKRKNVLKEAHDSITTGHDGIDGTVFRLRGLWWPSILQDVKSFVSTCKICQLRKVPRRTPPGSLQPHEAAAPMEVLSIDHLGKLPATVNGKQFVLVAVDVFTRFVFARANENQTAEAFKEFFLQLVAQFGPPKKLITDNHQAFCAKDCAAMFKQLNIKHQLSAGRYHRGNAPVERTIQSLQEKLSLLASGHNLDWENALPFAVLSLNTKACASTNYAPFELMFGRPVGITPPSITSAQTHNLFQEAVQIGASDLAKALSSSADAHLRARQRYESRRPQTSFEEGSLVLVRVSDRAPKLNPKYEGPYKVVTKEKDIYKIENVTNTKDKRMRHVSQLKAYNTMGVMVIAAIITTALAGQHLQEASPVLWEEMTDKFVSEGLEDFPYLLVFKSPCHLIPEYAQRLNNRTIQYNPKSHNEIPGGQSNSQMQQPMQQLQPKPQLMQIPKQQQNQPQKQMQPQQLPPPAQQFVPNPPLLVLGPPSQLFVPPPHQAMPDYSFMDQAPGYDDGELEELPPTDNTGQWMTKEEAERQGIRPSRISRRQANIVDSSVPYWNRCHELSEAVKARMARNAFSRSGRDVNSLSRSKRQASFILGMIVSDAISYFRQKFTGENQSTPESLKRVINNAVRKMNNKTDVVAVATKITAANQKKIAQKLGSLTYLVEALPSMEMFAEGIIAEVRRYDSLLDRLFESIKEDKLDSITLSQVFGTNQLEHLLLKDAQVKKLEHYAQGVLKFYFHGHIRSADTKVYRVHAFSFFTNLTAVPVRNDYVGKPFLIQNVTSNCVKAIDATTSAVVLDECETIGYRDPTLKMWRQTSTPEAWHVKQHSSHLVAWPHILVYCWGNQIGIGNETTLDWTPCPTYVFKLDYTQTFRTSDGLVVHVAKTKPGATEFDLHVILDVHDVHFDDYASAHRIINQNLELVSNLTELARSNVVVEWGDTELTYKQTTMTGLGLVGSALLVWFAFYLAKRCSALFPSRKPRKIKQQVQREVQREVQEAQREVTIEMQQQVSSEVNRQLNAQLNRIVMDNQNPVVPYNPRRSNRRRSSNRISIQELDNESINGNA